MTNIFENCGEYAAKWGISDFYEEDCLPIIKSAFESGKPFRAEWGCKKEIHYATLERDTDGLAVTVRTCIDERPDLVDTAIWEAFGRNEFSSSGFDAICKLHDLDAKTIADQEKAMAIMEEIEDGVRDLYQEAFTAERQLDNTASFDDLINTLDELESEAEKQGTDCYNSIVEYIRVWWDAIHEEADMNSGRFA